MSELSNLAAPAAQPVSYAAPAIPSPEPARPTPSIRAIWLLFAGVLLATLLFQLPSVADFQKFCLYDEGAWLRLDALVGNGRIPTVDIGYSYGALALALSRAWCTLFGHSHWAFIGFVTACNLLGAFGLARILHATAATWPRVLAACAILPIAIMPNNYSLMHPLEMALILLSLGQLAENRYDRALAWATLAVLAKPSMAYVLGLILVLLAIWKAFSNGTVKRLWRIAILPVVVGIAGFLLTLWSLGPKPALANILPTKAAAAYEMMDFGIFRGGRSFWLHRGSLREVFTHYLFTPASFWIAASLLLWALGALALARLFRRRAARPLDPLLVAVALMHAAFVFKFYGWPGSWTYYSYLPVLGVLVGLRWRRQTPYFLTFVLIGALGLTTRFAEAGARWLWTVRTPETAGMWCFPDLLAEAKKARALAADNHGLFLINGNLPAIWPEVQTPPVWFVSPGVLLDSEFDLIRREIADASVVVIDVQYDPKQEAWNWPEFAPQRALFEDQPMWKGNYFAVYRRR